jgi:hypothetical protein
MNEATEKLANAIIIQAVKDYRAAYRRMLRNPENREYKMEVQMQEKFFHSDWYEALTDADGGRLIEKVQEMEKIRFRKKKEAEHGATGT